MIPESPGHCHLRVAAGDEDCFLFLQVFEKWFRVASKFVESKSTDAKEFIALAANLNFVLSTPYYSRNAQALYLLVSQAVLSLEQAKFDALVMAIVILRHGLSPGLRILNDIDQTSKKE